MSGEKETGISGDGAAALGYIVGAPIVVAGVAVVAAAATAAGIAASIGGLTYGALATAVAAQRHCSKESGEIRTLCREAEERYFRSKSEEIICKKIGREDYIKGVIKTVSAPDKDPKMPPDNTLRAIIASFPEEKQISACNLILETFSKHTCLRKNKKTLRSCRERDIDNIFSAHLDEIERRMDEADQMVETLSAESLESVTEKMKEFTFETCEALRKVIDELERLSLQKGVPTKKIELIDSMPDPMLFIYRNYMEELFVNGDDQAEKATEYDIVCWMERSLALFTTISDLPCFNKEAVTVHRLIFGLKDALNDDDLTYSDKERMFEDCKLQLESIEGYLRKKYKKLLEKKETFEQLLGVSNFYRHEMGMALCEERFAENHADEQIASLRAEVATQTQLYRMKKMTDLICEKLERLGYRHVEADDVVSNNEHTIQRRFFVTPNGAGVVKLYGVDGESVVTHLRGIKGEEKETRADMVAAQAKFTEDYAEALRLVEKQCGDTPLSTEKFEYTAEQMPYEVFSSAVMDEVARKRRKLVKDKRKRQENEQKKKTLKDNGGN